MFFICFKIIQNCIIMFRKSFDLVKKMLIKGSALNVLKRIQEHFKNICLSYVFLKCSFQEPFQHI